MARIIELPELGVERSFAQQTVDALRGKTIINEATGIRARLSSSARGKLVSNKATGKSKANGFSQQQHNALVANIAEIYQAAALRVSRPDRDGDVNILSIKRFVTKVKFGRRLAAAWITVKESKMHGHHIYSVEAIKLEALDRIVEVVSGNTPHASSAPTRGMIAFFPRCVNAVLGKIFTHRSLLAATLAAALLALAPLAARADTVNFRGVPINYSGAEKQWIGEQGSGLEELVLVFKTVYDPNNPGATTCYFEPTAAVKINVVAIAGGGAGGTIRAASSTSQCAGGGGAGELVYRKQLDYAAGSYKLFVGAGGPSDGDIAAKSQGKNGSDSFMQDSSGTELLRVKGGGGGSGQSTGEAGGSGGGGSGRNVAGGASIKINEDGFGNAGGKGSSASSNYNRYGAGGGGAGEAGGSVTSATAGAGGAGVGIDITDGQLWFDVDDSEIADFTDGELVWCAGGGGGGTTYSGKAGGKPGKGGGGVGSAYAVAPDPGTPFTGSGGGAGGRTEAGAEGGCGVIIIRITYVEQPITWVPIDVSAGGNDGKIFIDENATYKWINNHTELVITYSNATVRGGLRFFDPAQPTLPPVWANARILTVGGGGGGGCVNKRAETGVQGGGGAGGGAGGFLEESGFVFSTNFEYSVSVGAGGKGGERDETAGGKGGNSSVKTNGISVLSAEAIGGGGGGAHCAGGEGGSGGGGSKMGSANQSGGRGLQGFAGGDGSAAFRGGGGGGAGGEGGTATNAVVGVGGIGKTSDITGSEVMYAGGGGGAFISSSVSGTNPGAAGGSGIGGHGAGVEGGVAIPAEDGRNGTGSGGGGGVSYQGAPETAGNGGSGIVIIRLSGFVVKSIPLPVPMNFTYDGNAHTGVVEFFAYELSGTPIAINSDVYSVTATMKPGSPYFWADWHEGDPVEKKWGPRTVSWQINQLKVPVPAAVKSVVYNSFEQYAVDRAKYHVDVNGYCYTDSGLKYCLLTPTYHATDATNYTFKAKLVADYESTPNVTNFTWASSPYTMDDRDYQWAITQAPNKIEGFTYSCYLLSRLDGPNTPHHPSKHFSCEWGYDTAKYEYRPVSIGGETPPPPEEGWLDWPPTEKGSYTLRITIPETPNWQGDVVTKDFGTWEQLADIFTDRMTVTVAGNTSGSTVLDDFPVPVRVKEPDRDGFSAYSGFQYVRAGATGKEVRFFDAAGDPVEHEVDTWNINGESVLWVRVPKLSSTGTQLTMCWRRTGDILLPEYDPTAVWNKVYNGVWHLAKLEDGVYADSSGNERHAYLTAGAKARAVDGPMAKALYIENGDLLVDGWPFKPGTLTNAFTYSGWYRYPDFVADNKITGGVKMFAGTKLGAASTTEMKTLPGWALRMGNAATTVNWQTTGQDWSLGISLNLKSDWGYLGYRTGYLTPTSAKGAGVARYYANKAAALTESGTDGIAYYVNGSDQMLQIATGGFEVDEVRFTTNVLTQAWMDQEYRTLFVRDYCTYSLVRIDCDRYNNGNGLQCDWWTTVPSIAKTAWRAGEAFPTEASCSWKSGAGVSKTYRPLPDGEPSATHPTAVGYYRATYDHGSTVTSQYRPQPYTIDFYIIEPTVPVYDIGGNGGDSGRVLLMNADNKTVEVKVEGEQRTFSCPITNQGWCAQSDSGVTYWRTLSGSPGTNNVMPGASFELVRSADTNVLWRLYDCRQGNTFPTNEAAGLSASLCYLPKSEATALSITNENAAATLRGDAGWVLMRNVACPELVVEEFAPPTGACVYSPCYSNGIGTIYFDALNGRKAITSGTAKNDESYRIVLEVATETTEGLPPWDENSYTTDGTHTNWYGRLEGKWRLVELSPMKAENGSYSDQPATNCFALKIASGGYQNRFYRIHARVDIHQPVRFRIRRVSVDETARGADGLPEPDDGYLLLDNIIASFPPVVAELKPYGYFDPTLGDVRAVGYGGAFETPFPSVADASSLTGRCSMAFTGELESEAEAFSLAQMFYRSRYLNQLRDPSRESGAEWKVAELTRFGDEMRTTAPLAVTNQPGDVEFYFVTILKTPYYGYVDYSGQNMPVWPTGKGGYTEEGLPHENRYAAEEGDLLASGGTDWFVRLREGRSRYEGLRLLTRPSGGGPVETNAFDLVGDDQWTVKLRTRNPVAKGLDVRIEGLNPQTPGAKEYAFSTDCWKPGEIAKFPSRESVTPCGADEWGWVACDAATGWLYFQLDMNARAVQVAHAEAEDFSRWSSALNASGLFVGSAVDTNASSAVTQEYDVQWGAWEPTSASSESWHENFTAPASVVTTSLYPRNVPFSTARSQFGWTAESALWTFGKWSQQNDADVSKSMGDDSAVQLMGLGQGRLSFIDASKVPDGLDTITYRARIGQVNDFNDFAHYEWYLGTSFEDMVPTRLMSDYTVATIAALTETGAASYDGDGSVSLIGYYNDDYGCYEFRVSRGRNDKDLRLALFRWRKTGAGYVCEPLYDSTAANRKNYFDYNSDNSTPVRGSERLIKNSKTLYGGLFLSVMEKDGKTLITAGLREGDVSALLDTDAMSGQAFTCITYQDSSSYRLTKGTFGLTSCNCPAIFAKPVCYQAGVTSYVPSKDNQLENTTGKAITFMGDKINGSASESYYTRWMKLGRLVRATGHEWWGFQAAAPEPQTVRVQISPHGASNWEDVFVDTVKGFTDEEFRNVIHDPRQCDVRLQVGDAPSSARTDVIVNEVAITQWNGQWTPNWDVANIWNYLIDDFVYTSAWVTDRSGRRSLLLQPTRARTETTPVSLRSPVMRGLGLLHFKWRNADPRARLRVQYKENVSRENSASVKRATETQASAETEVGDGWVDLTTIDVGAIGESGSRSVYINRRYDGFDGGRDYYRGLVRLIVDKDVQAEALSGDRRRTDPYYGAVEITEAFVWDLPEYDKSGWRGFNFRAAGWAGEDPDAWANQRDSFRGLSGLLNNTLDPDTLADREKGHYSSELPGVQSPTFGTNCVGALSFRARLYDDGDFDKTGYPAVVSVYGCNEKGEPRPGSWNWICDVEVSNRTYSAFSVKIPATLDCKAIRLAVKGVKGVTAAGTPKYDPPLRVAVDDIVIWERLSQSLAFRKGFVRPFRDAQAIKGTKVVPDIDQMAEQPLAAESFGFQAEVEVLDPDEVITGDPEHPVTVDLWYYEGGDVWGYENWKTNPAAVKVTGLLPATDAGDRLVFRSTVEQSASLCPPQFLEEGEGYRIVQYHVVAKYFVQGGSEGVHDLQSSEWDMPEWNRGFADPNATNTAFSAFTLLESIAPGRVWINEINYCEPNKNDSLANQYIELAVPSGVDMTDWTVTAYGWDGSEIGKLATLGRKLMPASKTYRGSNPIALASHYAFYTLKGPKTTTLPADGKWDGTWTVNNALEYNRPYAFELRRPTGVVEHRVVAQGWNQARDDGYWYAFRYDGTNTVEVMHQKDGGIWTWSQEDYHDAASANCSVSVVTNQGALHADWVSPLQKTPGDINIGQYIDPNWWIEPNGGYVKIYSNVIGAHMRQIIGNVTNTVGDMTISQGLSTNIVYEVDRWYQLGDHSVTPDERATWSGPQAGADGKRYYTLNLSQVSNRMDIVVAATNAAEVSALIDPKYAAYTPAIMRWLEGGVTGWSDGGTHLFKNPDGPLKAGWYRGNSFEHPLPIDQEATYSNKLDLVHLYWFDLDPTAGGWELWGGMGARPGSAGTLPVDERVDRAKVLASGETMVHTNHLTSFWMELKNAGLNEPVGLDYPPYRLQGLKNEQSDSWVNSWTSATFKVTMCLNNGKVDWVFRPMRYFVFGWDSFYPATDPDTPFAAVVEITDPFSNQSPASEWGWKKYESESMRENGLFTRWRIDGRITPAGVETLKKDSRLEF